MKATRGLVREAARRAKSTSRRGGLGLAAAGLLLTMGGPAAAMECDDLLFYVPFDDSLAPLIAKGSPDPELAAVKPTFGEGVIGKALIAGGKDESLSYSVKGNLDDR